MLKPLQTSFISSSCETKFIEIFNHTLIRTDFLLTACVCFYKDAQWCVWPYNLYCIQSLTKTHHLYRYSYILMHIHYNREKKKQENKKTFYTRQFINIYIYIFVQLYTSIWTTLLTTNQSPDPNLEPRPKNQKSVIGW